MPERKNTKHGDLGVVLPRREVLRGGLASFATAMLSPAFAACGHCDETRDPAAFGPEGAELPMRDAPASRALRSLLSETGPLGSPDSNGVRLPDGFTARVVARSGAPVGASAYVWHEAPDGGATFATRDGGFIYVSNSEVSCEGGAGALRFDRDGGVVSAYSILGGTDRNCSGARTPWHSWLSCEETDRGLVYECDPWGEALPVARPALGAFRHEAIAVDDVRGHLYLTEDESDGGLYRYVPGGSTPLGRPDLAAGQLEIAAVDGAGMVRWLAVPDASGARATREQVAGSASFDGGEGIWYQGGVVYFSTKGDERVWTYDTLTSRLGILYDGRALSNPPLTGVDNLTVSCCGDVLVAEDGGSMQIVAILPSGELKPLLQIVGQDGSEITGPAFDPTGTRLLFSSQRGGSGDGITFVVDGPFHAPA